MPKGEHFKKPNPRINQVSFKVNDKELKLLNELAANMRISVPEWIRLQINSAQVPENKEKPVKPIDKKIDGDVAENQMSLF